MKIWKTLTAALLLAFTVSACTTVTINRGPDDIPLEIIDFSLDNVWRVHAGQGFGSGFSIDEDYVLTACHVVHGLHQAGKPAFLTNDRDTRVVEMEVISCNKKVDVAILKKTHGDDLLSTFQGFHPQPEMGKKMYGAGHGIGGPLEIQEGYVMRDVPKEARVGADSHVYFTSALTVPGDSGSAAIALYDGVPLVIGIRVAVSVVRLSWTQIDLAQHFTYTVPLEDIYPELEKHIYNAQP